MNLELTEVSPTDRNNAYRVSIRYGDEIFTFLVEMVLSPIPTLTAPHSLWEVVKGDRAAVRAILASIKEVHEQGTSLPRVIQLDKSELPTKSLGPLWKARSSDWHLSYSSLQWAVSHLNRPKSNSFFPFPFEHKILYENHAEFLPRASQINIWTHKVAKSRQVLVPKASSGARFATQFDPLDSLIFSALAYEIGEQIETARVPASHDTVFSFRFAPSETGDLWRRDIGYEEFQSKTREMLDSGHPVVAETDISAFYHSIAPELVGASIERLGVKPARAEALVRLLRSQAKHGLPVGPAFSALFAESVLTPIDWELKAQRIEYVRFNDDFRFFCRNEIEAQRALQTLADLLWKVGQFTTQETKTKISSSSDFLERAGSDGWLEKLREVNQQQSYAHADQTRPVNDDLVSAARGVLIQALDPNHVAWIRLSKAAFSALPLREQLTVLPTVLAQLARVWSIAPLVQRSLRDFAASGYDTKMAVRLVVSSLSESQQTPDYAMTWLLHAFQEGDWSHKELLSSLNARLDPSLPIARRELLLALRGLGVAREIKFDPHDPWQARAFQYSTGAPPSTLPLRDKGRRARWDEALTDLITVLSRGQ